MGWVAAQVAHEDGTAEKSPNVRGAAVPFVFCVCVCVRSPEPRQGWSKWAERVKTDVPPWGRGDAPCGVVIKEPDVCWWNVLL